MQIVSFMKRPIANYELLNALIEFVGVLKFWGCSFLEHSIIYAMPSTCSATTIKFKYHTRRPAAREKRRWCGYVRGGTVQRRSVVARARKYVHGLCGVSCAPLEKATWAVSIKDVQVYCDISSRLDMFCETWSRAVDSSGNSD